MRRLLDTLHIYPMRNAGKEQARKWGFCPIRKASLNFNTGYNPTLRTNHNLEFLVRFSLA